MGIMGTLVHYSRIMARSNNAAIRALSIILYSQRNIGIHYPERIMDDEKTVHYPLFTQNDLPSPEQETLPAHRTRTNYSAL